MRFINQEASSIHGAIRVGSIYTSESGEWKLGGFELLSSVKEDESVIYVRPPNCLSPCQCSLMINQRPMEACYQILRDMRHQSWLVGVGM